MLTVAFKFPLKLVAVATPVITTPVWNVGAPVPALLVNKSALILPPVPEIGVTPVDERPKISGINHHHQQQSDLYYLQQQLQHIECMQHLLMQVDQQ